MAKLKRKAIFQATLIYLDEPQLIFLKAKGVNVIAVAVPSDDAGQARFLAVTATPRNFESYMEGNTDLRFLFTFPRQRSLYYFDLMKMVGGEVTMLPHEGPVPEADLPSPRLFSSEHTEEFELPPRAEDEQKLIIDGEWDMPEFGSFYGQYADIYYFVAATKKWEDPAHDPGRKANIAATFRDKPYQGGSSYKHFYNELIYQAPRDERAGLESIAYASPGIVKLSGKEELFDEVRELVDHYLDNRGLAVKAYQDLYNYLSRAKLLTLSGDRFQADNPAAAFIGAQTQTLSDAMNFPSLAAVKELVGGNALVAAKLLLSLFRRVEEASTYFAQGRMTYTD
ncbi:hypothetical protein ASG43_08865 [Aureimonas sp. Leaf454]|uniref:hypothetical protein n=1 Tax=Aureimonas sp. Leaf454 TaxID=1736381 RepID=UPI0006F4DD7F|nr:hypothetical protein [Aureimonas sp. Leaf454]KQT48934.1 hypothetical protein ASG43_08865 [Aureimonas sp. Leaf454]